MSAAQPVHCEFPLTTSVVLFVHIFMHHGGWDDQSRQLFRDWAVSCGEGKGFIQAGSCQSHWATLPADNSEYICLKDGPSDAPCRAGCGHQEQTVSSPGLSSLIAKTPGSDAYASDKGVFVKPTRAGVSSGWHSPSRRVWKGLKQ